MTFTFFPYIHSSYCSQTDNNYSYIHASYCSQTDNNLCMLCVWGVGAECVCVCGGGGGSNGLKVFFGNLRIHGMHIIVKWVRGSSPEKVLNI